MMLQSTIFLTHDLISRNGRQLLRSSLEDIVVTTTTFRIFYFIFVAFDSEVAVHDDHPKHS
jgi:hypothetical protein